MRYVAIAAVTWFALTTNAAAQDYPTAKVPANQNPIANIPAFEIYPPKEIPSKKKPLKPPIQDTKQLPKVAIIIDDRGMIKN